MSDFAIKIASQSLDRVLTQLLASKANDKVSAEMVMLASQCEQIVLAVRAKVASDQQKGANDDKAPPVRRFISEDDRNMTEIEKLAGLDQEDVVDVRDDAFSENDFKQMEESPLPDAPPSPTLRRLVSEDDRNMAELETLTAKEDESDILEDAQDPSFTSDDFKKMSEFDA